MLEKLPAILIAILLGGLFGGGMIYFLSRDAAPVRMINGHPLSYWIKTLDSDRDKTKKAAIATVPLFGIEAIGPTVELLDSPTSRAAAADALAIIGRPALPALLNKLAKGSPDTRLATLHAIDAMPFPPPPEVLLAVAMLMKDDATESAAAAYLLRVGPDVPAAIVVAESMKTGSLSRKRHALQVIARAPADNSQVAGALIRAASDDVDLSMKLEALNAICAMTSPPAEAADLLVELLRNSSSNRLMTQQIKRALIAIGPPAVPAMRKVTTRPGGSSQWQVIEILGLMQNSDPAAASLLLEFSRSTNPQIVYQALETRCRAASDRKAFVREQLHSNSPGARKWAAGRLRSEKPLPVNDLIDLLDDGDEDLRKVAETALERFSQTEWLPGMLDSTDIAQRKRSVALLGFVRSDQRYGLMITAMDDVSVDVRLAAVGAMSRALTSSRVVQRLTDALRKDPSPEVRAKAVRSLSGARELPVARDALIEAKKDPDSTVSAAAKEALAR